MNRDFPPFDILAQSPWSPGEWERRAAALMAGYRAEQKDELPEACTRMPTVFPSFVKVVERCDDRVRVRVDGREWWLIYGRDARWEEIRG